MTPPSPALAITYAWDNNGNLTGRGSDTFAWDYEDRMTSATVTSTTTTLAYRGERLRAAFDGGLITNRHIFDEGGFDAASGISSI